MDTEIYKEGSYIWISEVLSKGFSNDDIFMTYGFTQLKKLTGENIIRIHLRYFPDKSPITLEVLPALPEMEPKAKLDPITYFYEKVPLLKKYKEFIILRFLPAPIYPEREL